MLSWEDIVQRYIIKHSNQIQKTTRPLKSHFGINYFTYHKIDNNGKYTVLVDRPEWAEQYVDKRIYLNDPYLRQPSVYQSGLCVVTDHGSEEYKKALMREGKEILECDFGILLIEKKEQYVEFFGFAANKNNSLLNNLYINHPELIKSFAGHFKSELNSVLKRMDDETNTLLTLKGADYLQDDPIKTEIEGNIRLSYLQQIGFKLELDTVKKLTPRERDCLKLLVQEKSAKETATILGLSSRTVESYFVNIKRKLSCWGKQDVLKIARNLDDCGLL